LDARSTCSSVRDCGVVSYEHGLQIQAEYAALRASGEIGDTLLLCEHTPVYTLGTNAEAANVLDAGTIPVIQTDRGGDVTYHGPGQLVGYVICDVDARGRDLHRHCRDLEEIMLRVLETYGVHGARVAGRTGVWVGTEKVGALGVRVRKWISTHGFALNVDCDLAPFAGIVPCGIDDAGVTSLKRILGRDVDGEEVKARCAAAFEEVFLGA
jgi:lipoate-protein ligase B